MTTSTVNVNEKRFGDASFDAETAKILEKGTASRQELFRSFVDFNLRRPDLLVYAPFGAAVRPELQDVAEHYRDDIRGIRATFDVEWGVDNFVQVILVRRVIRPETYVNYPIGSQAWEIASRGFLGREPFPPTPLEYLKVVIPEEPHVPEAILLEIYHGSSTRDSLAEQVLRGSFDRYGKVFVGGEEGDQGREFTFSMSPEDVRTAQAGVNEVLHKIGLNGVPRAPVLWKRR